MTAGLLLVALSACGHSGDGRAQPVTIAPSSAAPGLAAVSGLPVGPPTEVPWWQGGVLHVGTTRIKTSRPQIVWAAGTTLVGVRPHHLSRWSIVAGTRLSPLPLTVGSSLDSDPVVSADGRRLAWVELVSSRSLGGPVDEGRGQRRVRLVAYDLARHRVSGTLDVTFVNSCCDYLGPLLEGALDDGRIVYHQAYRPGPDFDPSVRVWTPGHGDPVTVHGGRGVEDQGGTDNWPGGVSYLAVHSKGNVTGFGPVSARGVVTPRGGLSQADAQFGTWSPDGRRHPLDAMAYGVAIGPLDRSPGADDVLRLPGENWEPIAWESDTELILHHFDERGAAVRCDVTTRDCEQVADGPTGAAVMPGQS